MCEQVCLKLLYSIMYEISHLIPSEEMCQCSTLTRPRFKTAAIMKSEYIKGSERRNHDSFSKQISAERMVKSFVNLCHLHICLRELNDNLAS